LHYNLIIYKSQSLKKVHMQQYFIPCLACNLYRA